MAKKLYEMMQDRANIVTQMREIMDRFDDGVMDAEATETYNRLEKDFDTLNASIIREQKQLDRERAAGEVIDKLDDKKDERLKVFARALQGDPESITRYKNTTMTLGTNATAGYLTAPVEFVNQLIAGLKNDMFMRQICNVVGPIGQAQSLGYPSLTTDASDVAWTTEVAEAPEEATIAFGRREFKPQRLAKLVKISKTLMRHAPNPDQTVLDRVLYKLEAAQENAFMSGTGTNQPLGIFTASDSGIATGRDVTAASATAITTDDLIDCKYNVKGQYMRGAAWVMHRDLCKTLAKLKDSDGQYIWQSSIQAGQPDMLLGAPVHMSEYAPNTIAANNYVAVYGDFANGYWICDSDGLYIQVLNELYAVNNEIGYVVEYFGDGAPVVGEAFSRLKMKAN